RHLLQAEAFTIKGVQKILREQGVETVKRIGTAPEGSAGSGAGSRRSRATASTPGSAATSKGAPTRVDSTRGAGEPAAARVETALRAAIAELEAIRTGLSAAREAARVHAGRT
ncbi:MAG: hypothetical protein R3F55_00005, partial [Alphaproteobacteria bacterium]